MAILRKRSSKRTIHVDELAQKIAAIIQASPDKFQSKGLLDFRLSAMRNVMIYKKPIKWKLIK